MGEILKAAGCDFTKVGKATVLLADMNDFYTVNKIYKECFKSNFPARAAYQVAALSKGAGIEIKAVAKHLLQEQVYNWAALFSPHV